MAYCKVCGGLIPEGRVKLGYKDTCVKHSSTARFSGHIVADQKSTWINIIRDEETSKHLQMLSETRGK